MAMPALNARRTCPEVGRIRSTYRVSIGDPCVKGRDCVAMPPNCAMKCTWARHDRERMESERGKLRREAGPLPLNDLSKLWLVESADTVPGNSGHELGTCTGMIVAIEPD